MKRIVFLVLPFLALLLSSCDFVTYVTVRNHREPSEVHVVYDEKYSNGISSNDTMRIKHLSSQKQDGFLIVKETSPKQYRFTAPAQREIELFPMGINGHPISTVEIQRADSTVLWVNIRDRKQLKALKKQGIITQKGMIGNIIFIDNK